LKRIKEGSPSMHRFFSKPRQQLIIASFATIAVMLALAPAAFASASSAQAYNPGGTKVIDVSDKGTGASATPKGALAFTGLSLGLVAGAGVLLLGVGVGTRRLVATRLS
jgi:hypothetical protein